MVLISKHLRDISLPITIFLSSFSTSWLLQGRSSTPLEYTGSIFSLYGSWYFFWGIHSHTHTHTLRRNWAKNIWHTCWIQYPTKINCFRYHKLYHWSLSSFWSQLHSKLIDVFTQTLISPTGLSCPATYPPGPDQAIAAGKKNQSL